MKTIFTIWTHPRRTFEYLAENEESALKSHASILFYLGSLSLALIMSPASIEKYKLKGNHSDVFWIIVSVMGAMLAALFLTLIFKYLHSFMIWITGKLLQGKASMVQIQLVIAYSMVPGLVSLLISAIFIIIALFMNDIQILTHQNPFTLFLIWIFAIRTLIFGLSMFNRFSYGYAFLNLIIATGIIQGIALLLKHIIS